MTAATDGRPRVVFWALSRIGLVASMTLVLAACATGRGDPSPSDSPSLVPTSTEPSPSDTLGPIYFDDGTLVSPTGVGTLRLGGTLAEIGPGVVPQECGSVSRLPINVFVNLDESGRIILLSTVTDDLFYDPLGEFNIAWELRGERGVTWEASVDDVLAAYGPDAYIEEGILPSAEGGSRFEPRVVVPPSEEGEGVMIFSFGRFDSPPAPDTYGPLLEIRIAFAGSENLLRPCA